MPYKDKEKYKEMRRRLRANPEYKEKVKAYREEWIKKNPHYYSQYYKNYRSEMTSEKKEARRAYFREYVKTYKDDPIKRSARQKVTRAVRLGRIKRGPCEKCQDTKAQAHHDDYSKPFIVRWLCRTHHNEAHKLINAKMLP